MTDHRTTTPAIVAQLLADVAAHWGLSLHNLDGGRAPAQVDIRAIAQWCLHERYNYSHSEVARMFKKDHSTARHNIRRVAHFVRLYDAGEDNRLGRIARSVLLGGRMAAE